MGDVRFSAPYSEIAEAIHPASAIRNLDDASAVAALAEASRQHDPYLANVIASDVMNRMRQNSAATSSLMEGVISTSLDGRILQANPAAIRMLGRTRHDLMGRLVHDVIHANGCPSDGKGKRCPIADATILEERVQLGPALIRSRTGAEFPAIISVVPVAAGDEPLGAVITLQDVSASEHVRQLDRQRAAMMTASLDGVALVDDDGRFVYMNDIHAHLYGYERPADLIGKRWAILYEPDELDRFETHVTPLVESRGSWRGEAVGRRQDGSLFPQEVSLRATEPRGLVCIVRDITARKESDRRIAESEQKHRSLFRFNPRPVIALDRDGLILETNPRAAQLLGRADGEMAGTPFLDLLEDDSRERTARNLQAVVNGMGFDQRVTCRRDDDTAITGRLRLTPILVNGQITGAYAHLDLEEPQHAFTSDHAYVPAPRPVDEDFRLDALYATDILESGPEQVFDEVTALAAELVDVPIALITVVDRERQVFKSCIGLGVRETSRDVSFCAHAILQPHDIFVVPDTLLDPRFAGNPLVVNEPSIRFYAGVPLLTPDGFPLGTLCVIDRKPRQLTAAQLDALRSLGNVAAHQIALGRFARR